LHLSHLSLHDALPISLMANLHFTGSLWDASLMASLAFSSDTPSISNITLPGLTTATQYSGAPLPEPIRTSAGFLVTDLCGKILRSEEHTSELQSRFDL